jgi:hypothetical protein
MKRSKPLQRRTPLKPGKPLKSFRKKRRPGNRAMTATEGEIVSTAKQTLCVACLVWAEAGNMPMEDVAVCCDWNHTKSGNIRRGHDKGFAGCLWHHRGRVELDGWTIRRTRNHFGPSLMDGSRLFHATYGSDDYLIGRQRELLGLPPTQAA